MSVARAKSEAPDRELAMGRLLRQWRDARRMSQMDLAFAAGISPRHVSFVETGRSNPSRQVVLRLADALAMPLRDRNALLEAAGFARIYRETHLDDPEFVEVRGVLEFMLEQHEPYSAIVVDRLWNVLLANRPHHAFLGVFVPNHSELDPHVSGNLMRLLFHPQGLKPAVVNWEEVAGSLVRRLQCEAGDRPTTDADGLVEELLGYPGVPEEWAYPDPLRRLDILLPLHLQMGHLELRLASVVTTFGTPQDITLEEIRLETFFPADHATEEVIQGLARSSAQARGE